MADLLIKYRLLLMTLVRIERVSVSKSVIRHTEYQHHPEYLWITDGDVTIAPIKKRKITGKIEQNIVEICEQYGSPSDMSSYCYWSQSAVCDNSFLNTPQRFPSSLSPCRSRCIVSRSPFSNSTKTYSFREYNLQDINDLALASKDPRSAIVDAAREAYHTREAAMALARQSDNSLISKLAEAVGNSAKGCEHEARGVRRTADSNLC